MQKGAHDNAEPLFLQKDAMKEDIKKYLSEIGRKGGKASRRDIGPEEQEKMQAGRWIDIRGYEGIYQICKAGKVRSLDKIVNNYPHSKRKCKGRVLKPLADKLGYHYFQLSDKDGNIKNHKLHRLLCTMFIPNPNSYPEVNHKNGVKHDNRLENLEWCTHQQNMKHAYDNGLIPEPITIKGEKSNFAKLSDSQAREIKERLKKGEHPSDIAIDYPVGASAIKEIRAGRSWGHI